VPAKDRIKTQFNQQSNPILRTCGT